MAKRLGEVPQECTVLCGLLGIEPDVVLQGAQSVEAQPRLRIAAEPQQGVDQPKRTEQERALVTGRPSSFR